MPVMHIALMCEIHSLILLNQTHYTIYL